MSADEKELLERCRRCIRALLEVVEMGALWRVDVLDGARKLLAELEHDSD